MIINCIKTAFAISCSFFAIACDKTSGNIPAEIQDTTQVIGIIDSTGAGKTPSQTQGTKITVGNANGQNLVIDGTQQAFSCHTTIYIKGGNYSSITIKNIEKAKDCPVTVTTQGKVTLTGKYAEMKLSNLAHVTITGDITDGEEKGFSFSNNDYRAVILEGRISNTTLSNMEFSNIGDYVISYDNQVTYNGSENTLCEKLRFIKMDCVGSGPFINFSGRKNGSTIIGLYKDLEIAYLNYRNSPAPGIIVYLPNAEQFNIHHNTITNVNTQNNDHNAMFQIHGNGKFHNNFIANHQGNAIRSRPFSLGTTPKEILIYNNIVINSRKYSAFEVQTFSEDLIQNITTYANVKVYNNTCGNLNTSGDWYGVVLDAYNISGGKCEVFNNLAFNMPTPHPRGYIVSYMAISENDLTEKNNLYFKTSKEAGITDEIALKLAGQSPAKAKGIKVASLTSDFYGANRNKEKPSVGAVE